MRAPTPQPLPPPLIFVQQTDQIWMKKTAFAFVMIQLKVNVKEQHQRGILLNVNVFAIKILIIVKSMNQ
jgi:hypothetical protein